MITPVLARPMVMASVAEDETQCSGKAAVDPLEVLFEREVVCQVETANACRVAAAAEILEKQRVVEIGKL